MSEVKVWRTCRNFSFSWNAVGDESNRHGTIPDYVAETKIADLLRGIDTQLEVAMKPAVESGPDATAEPPGTGLKYGAEVGQVHFSKAQS